MEIAFLSVSESRKQALLQIKNSIGKAKANRLKRFIYFRSLSNA